QIRPITQPHPFRLAAATVERAELLQALPRPFQTLLLLAGAGGRLTPAAGAPSSPFWESIHCRLQPVLQRFQALTVLRFLEGIRSIARCPGPAGGALAWPAISRRQHGFLVVLDDVEYRFKPFLGLL